MKAISYKPVKRSDCDTDCATDCAKQNGTVQTKRVQKQLICDITRDNGHSGQKWHSPGKKQRTVTKFGTVRVTVQGQYGIGLEIMDQKRRLIWLTVQRAAELKQVSMRTMWRIIVQDGYLTEKVTVSLGRSHTNKTFIMSDEELLNLEQQDCHIKKLTPSLYLDRTVVVKDNALPALFIYGYSSAMGDTHESA